MAEAMWRAVRFLGWAAAVLIGLIGVGVTATGMSIPGGLVVLLGASLLAPPVASRLSAVLGGRRWAAPLASLVCVLVIGPVVLYMTQPTPAEYQAMAEERSAREAEKAAVAAKAKEEHEALAEKRRQEKALEDRRAAEEKRRKDCSDTISAFVMSQGFVERQLRSPSTAKFPYMSADGVSSRVIGDCRFRVSAYVDSQNGFGAMIRSRYTIEMEYAPSTKLWRGSGLQIQ